MWKKGNKIYVFDGSNYGKYDLHVPKGVYKIVSVPKMSGDVIIRAEIFSLTKSIAFRDNWRIPFNQFCETNDLVNILYGCDDE